MQSLIGSLVQQFGLRPEQIQAGAGVVLQLLQEKAGGADFQQLLASLPGAQAWIEKVQALPQQGGSGVGGLLGQASSILGAVTGQDASGLAGILGKLEAAGFNAQSATQFVPALLEQLKGAAGADVLGKVLQQVPALKGGGGLLGGLLR